MRASNLFGLVFTIATTVLGSPTPPGHTAPASVVETSQTFYLRANCPNKPWHGRHIVTLPTSQQLGLENFTVHPETPPLEFRPVKVANGNYALKSVASSDDPSETAYLAALKSTTGTRTAGMAIVSVTMLTRHSFTVDADTCPPGYECIVDQWMFDAAINMALPNFRFAGFEGKWKPFKDAGKEGWHVYWKGDTGVYGPIELDLVSMGGYKEMY